MAEINTIANLNGILRTMRGILDWAERHKFISVLVLLMFIGIVMNIVNGSGSGSPAVTQPAVAATSTPATNATGTPQVAAAPQTDQQKLEAAVQSQLGGTGTQVSFRDANIDTDDPDRPPGSNFVTINLNLGDFWDKAQLTNESATIVSNIIQQVYPINPHFYDVLVMFYGPTKDEYGNSKDAPILSYGTDRPEEERLNWVGFDKTSLCSLLGRDATARDDLYLGCHFLVNVQ